MIITLLLKKTVYCKEFYWTMQTLIEVGSQYDRDINLKKTSPRVKILPKWFGVN